jgi:hypothetical protein
MIAAPEVWSAEIIKTFLRPDFRRVNQIISGQRAQLPETAVLARLSSLW